MSTKPLPPPPSTSCTPNHTSPAFTPEAIVHLRKLLTQTLDGERLDSQWVNHLEKALLDLAEASNKGRWLLGLRNKRKRQWPSVPLTLPPAVPDKDTSKTNEESDKEVPPVLTDIDLTRLALVQLDALITSERTTSEHNHLLITLSPPSSINPFPDLGIDFDLRPHRETCSFHPGVFNLPFFTTTEHASRRGQGGVILCGLEDCKAEISKNGISNDEALPNVKVVGGNFTLKGVYSADDHVSLAKVLRIGIYGLLSLQLELNLHRDTHVPLVYPPPPPAILKKPRPRSPSPVKVTLPSPDESRESRPSKSVGGGPTSSIWNFIAKKTSGIMRPLHIIPPGSSQSHQSHHTPPVLPHVSTAEPLGVRVTADGYKHIVPPTPTPLTAHFPGTGSGSHHQHHGRSSLDIVRTFSHHLRLTTSDDLVHKHPRPNLSKEDHTLMMFSSAVAKITHDQAVLSTSPGMKFPPPSLLRRLAEKEATSVETKIKFRLTGDEKAGLTSILGWHDSSEGKSGEGVGGTGMVVDTMTFLRHQRLTVLYAEHVPATEDPPIKDLVAGNSGSQKGKKEKGKEKDKEKEGSGADTAGTDAASKTEESVQGDVASSTSSAIPHSKATSTESSASSFHISQQQAIPPGYSQSPQSKRPTKPCIAAHWRTYAYYSQIQTSSPNSPFPDMCLGMFIHTTIESAVQYIPLPKSEEKEIEEDIEVVTPVCDRPGCGKKRLDHGLDWIHAGVKVMARIEEVDFPSDSSEDDETDGEGEGEIWIWNGCKICGEKGEKTCMSDGTFLFSFAKYLELLIYSPSLCNIQPSICPHTSPPITRPSNRPKRSGSSANRSKALVKSTPTPIAVPSATAQAYLLSSLPQERFNILRYFHIKTSLSRKQKKGYALVFEVSPVESDVFEVRVPRVQIVKSVVEVKKSETEARKVRFGIASSKDAEDDIVDLGESGKKDEDEDEEKKELRGEIEDWWEGVKDRLSKLEGYIQSVTNSNESEGTLKKSDYKSKRLPSMPHDDEDEELTPIAKEKSQIEGEEEKNDSSSVKAPSSGLGPPPTSSSTTSLPSQNSSLAAPAATSRPTSPFSGFPSLPFSLTRPSSPAAPQPPPKDIHNKYEILDSLQELKSSLVQSEQQIYSALSSTNTQELNDVRRAFTGGARAARRKLKAWEEKFVGKGWAIEEGDASAGELELDEPDWWDKGKYVLPKNRVVLRERDWGSIIAFTLSSPEYRRELENMATGRKFSGAGTSLASARTNNSNKTTAVTVPSTPSSISLTTSHAGSPSKLTSGSKTVPSTPAQLEDDPFSGSWTLTGYEDIEGMEMDQYSAVVTRKEHPKDISGILSLRDVLRNQRTIGGDQSATGGSISSQSGNSGTSTFSSLSNSASRFIRLGMNPGAERDLPEVPPSAWAKPAVELSASPVKGELRVNGRSAGNNGMGMGVGEERLGEIMQQLAEQDAAMISASVSAFSSSTAPGSSAFSSSAGSATGSLKGLGSVGLTPSSSGGIARASSVLSAVDDVDEGGSGSGSGSGSMASSVTAQQHGLTTTEDLDLGGSDESDEDLDGRTTPARTRTPTQSTAHSRETSSQTITPPPLPPKDTIYRRKARDLNSSPPVTPIFKSTSSTNSTPMGTSASNTGSITSTIANAMRYMLNPLVGTPESTPTKQHHHALLATHHNFLNRNVDPGLNAFTPIDERPHIKYDFTLGKRLKFSCTVYFARQFDMLRKRCGVDGSSDSHADVVRSLARCVGWEAEGGKSKSSFLKSEDDRFIIKTLVNAWNVADLQVLLELSSSYFRYMDQTSSHASVLAKLMGFYTIEIKNLETGQTNGRADLLVMENLFYGFKIEPGRTFDLKGISGRKVKPVPPPGAKEREKEVKPEESKTPGDGKGKKKKDHAKPAGTAVQRPLFDGDWIEGQQKTLILVEPHSKAILNEAIKGDAEFLARSNIMDYSLLLGIDQERRQIACGLVDTIGSYTFAKTLEYKAKQGLTGGSGREVTVLPPSEYQDRFVNAMQSYFLACPDKWSKVSSSAGDNGCSDSEEPPHVF